MTRRRPTGEVDVIVPEAVVPEVTLVPEVHFPKSTSSTSSTSSTTASWKSRLSNSGISHVSPGWGLGRVA
jgi:hypothetical protein